MAVKTIRDVVPISLLLEACRTPKPLNLCIAYRSAGINTRRIIHDTCLSPAIEPLAYKIARLCPLPLVYDAPRGQVVGQQAPGTAGAEQIEDPVEDLALGVDLRPAAGLGFRDIGPDQLPFCIRHIGRVRWSRVHGLKGSRFEPARTSFLDTLLASVRQTAHDKAGVYPSRGLH